MVGERFTVTHGYSFVLTIVICVATAALTVAFNGIHVIGLVADIGLIWGLRALAHSEGRYE
jgi:hypothetical protein